MNNSKIKLNRLQYSKSPYLYSHRTNPIDWYPWGEEAFKKAAKEDKLIFLSIGYFSCRWCHKMNRECFSNEEVGEILNRDFVSIKVDKEERADIDKLYMMFSEALTGITGWPLNIILTPDGKPIYAGNYMTVEGDEHNIGIKDILTNINKNWIYRRDDVLKKSKYILLETDRLYNSYSKGILNRDVFLKTRDEIFHVYDWKNGGYYTRPKFLLPQYSLFLLKYYIDNGDEEALNMALNNAISMYRGGIYDHVAGGFFRYSTSNDWNNPHFEKMLGENALMAILYAMAYGATKDKFYMDISQDIFKFIIRDLMSEEGAFYTSIDAEFNGVEGGNYFLSREEIIGLLGEEVGDVFIGAYNIGEDGSYLPNLMGTDLLELKKTPIKSIVDMIYEYRVTKGVPDIDEKILASMNGLLIGSMSYAGSLFKDKFLIERARVAMDFIIENMLTEDYEIYPIYMKGEAYGQGVLLDYSYVLFGLINLYISTEDYKYIDIAKEVSKNIRKHFWNDKDQTLYLNNIDRHDLIIDLKDNNDGSMASSSGIMAYNWVKLYKITGDSKYYTHYRNMINSYSGDIIDSPNAHIYSIISMFYI